MFWDEIINNIYFNGEELHSIFNYLREGKTLLSSKEENTSKILLMRREYWAYALLNILPVNNVLIHHLGRLQNAPDKKLEQLSIANKTIQNVFSETTVNIFSLTGNDVYRLSKKNEHMRDLIKNKIDEKIIFDNDDYAQYNELLENAVKVAKERYTDSKWDAFNSIKNIKVTIIGFIANLTPIGPLYSNAKTTIDLAQNIKSVIPLNNEIDQDFYIMLARYNARLHKQVTKINDSTEAVLL